MTDPVNLSSSPFFLCDHYRLIDLFIDPLELSDGTTEWTVNTIIIPDWSDDPIEFSRSLDTYEEAKDLCNEIERLAD